MQRLAFCAQAASGGSSLLTDPADGLSRHQLAPAIR